MMPQAAPAASRPDATASGERDADSIVAKSAAISFDENALRGSDPKIACPVCEAPAGRYFAGVDGRDYWRCDACDATWLDAAQRPSAAAERAHYELHENDPDDPAYRRFVSRLVAPLLERLPPAQRGLDYGCGPGPALAAMLREAGHAVSLYDPFFAPCTASLRRTYDFVACSEAFEHFHAPAAELRRLDALLRAGGWLGIMTCFQTDDSRFARWHYRRDPTHVVFYREATFASIAQRMGWHCEIPGKDVVLMQKPPVATTARVTEG
jgi:ribosomal protein L37AE/L43A